MDGMNGIRDALSRTCLGYGSSTCKSNAEDLSKPLFFQIKHRVRVVCVCVRHHVLGDGFASDSVPYSNLKVSHSVAIDRYITTG